MEPLWLEIVREKAKRKNKVLFTRDSPCLQELLRLIRRQSHACVVFWAFACMEKPLGWLEELLPGETRPRDALLCSREWAAGQIKMPVARRAILEAHQAAKDTQNPVVAALCHSIGQGCATVHVETHAIGLPMYELTALVLAFGLDNCQKAVEARILEYEQTLRALSEKKLPEPLAPFLLADRPNREQLLYEKSPYGWGL